MRDLDYLWTRVPLHAEDWELFRDRVEGYTKEYPETQEDIGLLVDHAFCQYHLGNLTELQDEIKQIKIMDISNPGLEGLVFHAAACAYDQRSWDESRAWSEEFIGKYPESDRVMEAKMIRGMAMYRSDMESNAQYYTSGTLLLDAESVSKDVALRTDGREALLDYLTQTSGESPVISSNGDVIAVMHRVQVMNMLGLIEQAYNEAEAYVANHQEVNDEKDAEMWLWVGVIRNQVRQIQEMDALNTTSTLSIAPVEEAAIDTAFLKVANSSYERANPREDMKVKALEWMACIDQRREAHTQMVEHVRRIRDERPESPDRSRALEHLGHILD